MLTAADALFKRSDGPATVTMDEIATAAGIGKATLFRAFGSRDSLLDTLWALKIAALRDAVDRGAPPFGIETRPAERLVAFLDGVLLFKIDNRHLIRARELGTGLLRSPHYVWLRDTTCALIHDAADCPTEQALCDAHALLAALHIDLIDELRAGGLSLEAIRSAQAARVRAVLHVCPMPERRV